jgi:hypothetical protein
MLLSDLLNQKAQDWWYHKQLRDQGDTEEAQRRERLSILSTLIDLKDAKKNGGWCSVGRGSWTLRPRPGVTVSCVGGLDSVYPQACLIMGIQLIYTTTIPDSEIMTSILFPMASSSPDAPPWGSCSYAPVAVVAALYSALGAVLYNIKPDYEGVKNVQNLPESVRMLCYQPRRKYVRSPEFQDQEGSQASCQRR